jgi:hypothetical protein
MKIRRRYRKRADQFVVAVELDLETEGFSYFKWGAQQRCKRGDWLVDNGGDIYTVDREVFANTYRKVDVGKYVKTTPVWAEVAAEAGSVVTKEGKSSYEAGDYLVYNNEDGSDAYCVSAAKFESMYELDE